MFQLRNACHRGTELFKLKFVHGNRKKMVRGNNRLTIGFVTMAMLIMFSFFTHVSPPVSNAVWYAQFAIRTDVT